MQLKLIIILAFVSSVLYAQTDSENAKFTESDNDNIKKVEIDFFAGYYEQDGEHSAVEGGIGSQKLNALESFLFIHVVTDSVNSFNVNLGIDAYTSASSDKIDKYTSSASYISSASSSDVRPNFNLKYSRKIKNHTISPKFSFSHEFDVTSVSAGLDYSFSFNNDNTELALGFDYFYDTWLLIYPAELRHRPEYTYQGSGGDDDRYGTDVRKTGALSFSYSQVLTKRIQMSFLLDYVSQNGILYTPFHRVYFDDGIPQDYEELKTVEAEFLPRQRYKVPIGLRLNWFVTDFMVANFYYRYYYDSFELYGNTYDASLAFKIGSSFVLKPFYRYYNQSASMYFAPYGKTKMGSEFYTSDYDLSKFTSQKYGLGIKFSPVFGIARMKFPSKRRLTVLKSIELRYANYSRSDGLNANILSFLLSIKY